MSDSPLRVAIVGLGTVGTGVARVLCEHSDRMTTRAGRPIELRRAVVRDLSKPRDIELPAGVITTDLDKVIRDPEIDLAIHLVGGLHPAKEILLALLDAGKDVVTANKAILCEYGAELFERARERKRTIAFEAAVAGGIPIIATLSQSLQANQITAIEAILNGTSNFILTEMLACGRSFSDVLRQAQALGYAEADPTMDIDGTDTAQKLVLLTQLAFGTRVSLSQFTRQGIDSLELADLYYAGELGYTVKLLALAKLQNQKLEMRVQPMLVRSDRPLAKVDGPHNMISLVGDVVGQTWYAGPGAGQMPTASAVLADVIDMAVGRAQLTFERMTQQYRSEPFPVQPAEDIASRYYLRFNAVDRPHVFADITHILGKHDISLASVIQHEAPELDEGHASSESIVPLVVMTHRTTAGRLQAADRELEQLSALRQPRVYMPVAD
ncbi:MAG: homoserine dehydrogenase [Planctomycetaceae bacterium]